jgi:hypothetical protein
MYRFNYSSKNCYYWAEGEAQVVENLLSKHEALSSNPSTAQKRKKE